MAVSDWSTNADLNTSIDDIDISEHCPAKNMNDALRHVMAGVKGLADDAGHGYYVTDISDVPADAKTGSTIYVESDVPAVDEDELVNDLASTIASTYARKADVMPLPIGAIFPYSGTDIPSGCLRANGNVVEHCNTLYPEFYSWVLAHAPRVALSAYTLTEGQCGSYGVDEATGAVRLPCITAYVKGGETAGEVKTAGLPNITGGFWNNTCSVNSDATNGAFGPKGGSGASGTRLLFGLNESSSPVVYGGATFDASRSSPIYGNSTTVTPTSVVYPYVIVVWHSVTTQGTASFSELMNTKANRSLDNVTGLPVERVEESGYKWIRYSNGIQMCWGHFNAATQGDTVTFSKAFISTPAVLATENCGSATASSLAALGASSVWYYSISPTGFNVGSGITGDTDKIYGSWLAIGTWK